MRVSLAKTLGHHSQAWDSLVGGMPIPSPFLRSWWVNTAAGTEPYILLVHEGDLLVGGLALERDRHFGVERLRVLGGGALCPDHIDVVAAPGLHADVGAAIAAWLARPGDRLLDLDGVVSNSVIAAALQGLVLHERSGIAPWVDLEQGYVQLRRSRNLRNALKRTENRIVNEAGKCSIVRIDDISASLELLRGLHRLRWGGNSAFLAHFDRFTNVARAAAARRELSVEALRAGDIVVAVDAFFEVAGRVSFYQGGRIPSPNWRGAGVFLLASVIEDSARRGLREADLLRGGEEYKVRLASQQRELWRLHCAIGARASVVLQMDKAKKQARRMAGSARRRLRARGLHTGAKSP